MMGLVSAAWGVVYLRFARDTPEGSAWRPPLRQGALEVTSRASVLGLIALMVPVLGVMGVIALRVRLVHVISFTALVSIVVVLAALLVITTARVVRVNRPAWANAYPVELRFP